MHDPKYTEMLNAIHAKCNYSRLGYSKMAYDDATANTYSTRNWNTMQLV